MAENKTPEFEPPQVRGEKLHRSGAVHATAAVLRLTEMPLRQSWLVVSLYCCTLFPAALLLLKMCRGSLATECDEGVDV